LLNYVLKAFIYFLAFFLLKYFYSRCTWDIEWRGQKAKSRFMIQQNDEHNPERLPVQILLQGNLALMHFSSPFSSVFFKLSYHNTFHRLYEGGFCLDFFLFMYVIQHCFICRPADSTVSEDAGIEPRTVANLALAAPDAQTTRLDLIMAI
jgi:hypothetical protein